MGGDIKIKSYLLKVFLITLIISDYPG